MFQLEILGGEAVFFLKYSIDEAFVIDQFRRTTRCVADEMEKFNAISRMTLTQRACSYAAWYSRELCR